MNMILSAVKTCCQRLVGAVPINDTPYVSEEKQGSLYYYNKPRIHIWNTGTECSKLTISLTSYLPNTCTQKVLCLEKMTKALTQQVRDLEMT